MSSGSYYEEEMSSGGHRSPTAFILWSFSPSKNSPLDPPSPWSWLGAYLTNEFFSTQTIAYHLYMVSFQGDSGTVLGWVPHDWPFST